MAWIVFFIIPMVLGFWAQHRVKSTFAKNLEVRVANGMTGAQVARRVLDANGLNEVPVEETPGSLSDHYDPRSRSVHLSPDVFQGVSVASTAVARTRSGTRSSTRSRTRSSSSAAPCSRRCSSRRTSGCSSSFGGIFLQIAGLIVLAIALYAVAVLFQLVTLPVEFDASRRAKRQLHDLGLVASTEAHRREERRSTRPPGRTSRARLPRSRCSSTSCRCSTTASEPAPRGIQPKPAQRDESACDAPREHDRERRRVGEERVAVEVHAVDDVDEVRERQDVRDRLEDRGEVLGRPEGPERNAIGRMTTLTAAETPSAERMSAAAASPSPRTSDAEDDRAREAEPVRGHARVEDETAEHEQRDRLEREGHERREQHRRQVDAGRRRRRASRFSTPASRRMTSMIARPPKAVFTAP